MKGLIKRLLREDFGYRAGNLVDKAELLKNTKGSRGTGHFGTGFYFFGDENVAKEYAKGSNREGKDRVLSTIDLSKYNLLRVTDDELDAYMEQCEGDLMCLYNTVKQDYITKYPQKANLV